MKFDILVSRYLKLDFSFGCGAIISTLKSPFYICEDEFYAACLSPSIENAVLGMSFLHLGTSVNSITIINIQSITVYKLYSLSRYKGSCRA